MAQTQININAGSGGAPTASASDVNAAVLKSLDTVTLGSPSDAANRKFVTEKSLSGYQSAPLTLLNGFTAKSAQIWWNLTNAVIGIEELQRNPQLAAQVKICDIPIPVATSPLVCTGGTPVGYMSGTGGYAQGTEVFGNRVVSDSGANRATTLTGNFTRI